MVGHRLKFVKRSGCIDFGFPGVRYSENSIRSLWITCGARVVRAERTNDTVDVAEAWLHRKLAGLLVPTLPDT